MSRHEQVPRYLPLHLPRSYGLVASTSQRLLASRTKNCRAGPPKAGEQQAVPRQPQAARGSPDATDMDGGQDAKYQVQAAGAKIGTAAASQ